MRYVDPAAIELALGIVIADPFVPTPVSDQPLMSTASDPVFQISIHSSAVDFSDPAHAISERTIFGVSAARRVDRGDITDSARRSPRAYVCFIDD